MQESLQTPIRHSCMQRGIMQDSLTMTTCSRPMRFMKWQHVLQGMKRKIFSCSFCIQMKINAMKIRPAILKSIENRNLI